MQRLDVRPQLPGMFDVSGMVVGMLFEDMVLAEQILLLGNQTSVLNVQRISHRSANTTTTASFLRLPRPWVCEA